MITEMVPSKTATDTHTSQDKPASSRTAMMMPPMDMMGAVTMKFSIIM